MLIWVFPEIGYPPIIHFNKVFHYKPSILGYPYCWKHPYNPLWVSHISGPLKNGCFHFVILPLRWDVSDLVPSLANRRPPVAFWVFPKETTDEMMAGVTSSYSRWFHFFGGKCLLSTRAKMIQFWLLRISDGWLNPQLVLHGFLHGFREGKHWTKSGLHCHPLGLKWWESTSFWDTGGHIAITFVLWRSLLTIDNKNFGVDIADTLMNLQEVSLVPNSKLAAYNKPRLTKHQKSTWKKDPVVSFLWFPFTREWFPGLTGCVYWVLEL